MFCPNYKNKEVKDGFNEIIEALGGKPLTDEEFRSSELRNKRTGLDYSAMESAYKVYHRNNGNMLDLAPNGEHSVLFKTLLEHFGNRDAAIVAKSNVYSDEFFNWFGNWTAEEKENVSKVVDENGEPLVVWHHTNDKNLDEFRLDFENYFQKDGGTNKAFFFDENTHGTLNRKYDLPVYLNIKNLNEYNGTKEQLHESGTSYRAVVNESSEQDDIFGGVHMKDFDDNKMEHQSIWITHAPNQIKHVENLGSWSIKDSNVYHVSAQPKTREFRTQSVVLDQFFGKSFDDLQNEKMVTSSSIIQHLLDTEAISSYNIPFAEIAVAHEIPVTFSELESGKPMAAREYEDGTVIIEIDPNQITLYSQEDAAEYLLHEVVHALSVKALRRPETVEEKEFSTATKKIYDIFDKLLPETEYSRANMDSGAYILFDMYEFAAVFATDKNARMLLYQKAVEEDKKGNNKVFLRVKKFVNALSRLLVNKNVFKGIKEDELKIYEKKIQDFLKTRKPTVKVDIVEEFNKNLEALKPDFLNNSRIALLKERLYRHEANFVRHYVEAEPSTETDATKHERLWKSRMRIAEALQTRLAAIVSSTIDDDVKYNAKHVVQTQIEQFRNPNVSNVKALSSFIQQTVPQLLDDVNTIRHMSESSHSFYMYHMHDNFGAYVAIFNRLDIDFKDDEHKRELEEEFQQFTEIDKLSAVKDVKDMLSIIKEATSTANDGVHYMYNILMNNLRRDLSQLGDEVNFASTKAMLDSLSTVGFDTNSFINILGSKDGAEDPVIRSIVYLVNKALRKSKKDTVDVANKLLKLQSELKMGESPLDLFELDENGRTTQYLVRELNFGKFYNDYKKFLESMNEEFGLPKGNRNAPLDMADRKKWNIKKNKWLSIHAERRFKPEYYEAYAELSDDTLQQLNNIRNAISQLKELAYDEKDGYYHYEKLSPEEWKRLQGLYIEKRLLGSDYTLYGDLKIEGTDAYRWAKEIQSLNEKLYNDPTKMKRATDAWQKARNEFIQASIKKYTKDGEVNMSAVNNEVKAWDERNSKRVFKKDGDKLAIFKRIDEEVEKLTGITKPNYGEEYENNRERINEMINIFRDYNTGEPNIDIMPSKVRKNVKELEKLNAAIKRKVLENNPELRKNAKKWDKAYRRVFSTYLKSEYTSYYKKQLKSTSDFIDAAVDDSDVRVKIPRWATKLVVKNKVTESGESFISMFTDLIPGDGWINSDEGNSLLNDNYDQSMNVPFIPKKEINIDGKISKPYDNSIAYNKIKNSPTLRALYEGILESMRNANGKLFNRLYQDDYMLPGITGSMWKYMKGYGMNGAVTQALRYTLDHAGFTEQGISQDQSFGSVIKDILGSVSELDEFIQSESSFGTKTTGTRPDGRQFNIIPMYYTKKLEDTSQLSSDLIGMVCEYYECACNFENKSEIKDFVESMVDVLETRRYEIVNKKTGNTEVKEGKTSKTFQGAKKFVEMNLYNIRSSQQQFGKLNLGKTAQNFSKLTQALNLGMSPAVALTGYFTAQYSHLINALVGDRGYSMKEWTQATGEVIGHYIRNYGGAGYASNQLSKDKVMLLAEYFDVANQLKRKFEHSNRSRIVRFLDNWCFGGLVAVDFASKSTIMTTILMAHRYMDGKFVSREDVLNKLEASTEEGKKALLERWEKGKTLYSVFNVTKDGKLEVEKDYCNAFALSENTIYNRINKTAESADGMATETQKAAITTNFFGAAVLTHRQYLPLMIQQRFLPQVWDFDIQMYTQGQYIVGWEFWKNVCWKTIKDGLKYSTYLENYKKFTHDTSSEEAWKLSRARQKALKKTATEIAVFSSFVIPLVSLICMWADGDDQKDNLALQLAAYIARRTQWETFTPYRFSDMMNNIKSVSAQTGTLDKFDALLATFSRNFYGSKGSLFDTLLGLSQSNSDNDIISRGVYEGHTRTYKVLMQMTPYHNLYEQWYGAKAKRNYYEKQIMKLDE